jgi:hypothetical protein
MSGADCVPLFSSFRTGTLCGHWPDIGLWPIVLSLADRHGIVDVTPAYIASVTGLRLEDVIACMARFCGPDAYSRSTEENGARLVLLDPDNRDWGWRVVNHGKYRERARKAAYDADRTSSGQDAERKREARKASRDTTPCPDASRDLPLLDTTVSHEEVIRAYHEILPEAPQVKVWSKKRRQALDARIRERCKDGKPAATIAYWRGFFEQVAASDFLCGRATSFVASLEWLLRPENFLKVIEGNYANRTNGARARG